LIIYNALGINFVLLGLLAGFLLTQFDTSLPKDQAFFFGATAATMICDLYYRARNNAEKGIHRFFQSRTGGQVYWLPIWFPALLIFTMAVIGPRGISPTQIKRTSASSASPINSLPSISASQDKRR
jgi:hypothetical protein